MSRLRTNHVAYSEFVVGEITKLNVPRARHGHEEVVDGRIAHQTAVNIEQTVHISGDVGIVGEGIDEEIDSECFAPFSCSIRRWKSIPPVLPQQETIKHIRLHSIEVVTGPRMKCQVDTESYCAVSAGGRPESAQHHQQQCHREFDSHAHSSAKWREVMRWEQRVTGNEVGSSRWVIIVAHPQRETELCWFHRGASRLPEGGLPHDSLPVSVTHTDLACPPTPSLDRTDDKESSYSYIADWESRRKGGNGATM